MPLQIDEDAVYVQCSVCNVRYNDTLFQSVYYTRQTIPGLEHVCAGCLGRRAMAVRPLILLVLALASKECMNVQYDFTPLPGHIAPPVSGNAYCDLTCKCFSCLARQAWKIHNRA